MKIVVVNGNIEFFLTEKNQVGEFERIDTEIICKFSLGCNIVGTDTKLIDEQGFEFFKHTVFLQNIWRPSRMARSGTPDRRGTGNSKKTVKHRTKHY